MKNLLDSDTYVTSEIITAWNEYIEDESNLIKSLNDLLVDSDQGVVCNAKSTSLARIMLQVPQMQRDIADRIFDKLLAAILLA